MPAEERSAFRLLMTTDAVGGVWQYSVDLCSGLAAEGAEILLACMGPEPSPEQRDAISAIARVDLAWEKYSLEWMPNAWDDVDASGLWLSRLARSFRPDLVHLNGYSHAALDWQLPVAVTAHSCVFSWWKAVHGQWPGPDWAEYHRRVSAGLEKADVVFAPSRHMAAEITSIYPFAPAKLRVIHNFSSVEARFQPRKETFILAAGRMWDEAKNVGLLERISGRVHAPVCIASNLPHAEVLEKMASARVFAHPALYEPFGLAVLEAARSSCALVLADIPSLRELWDGAAIFVDPRDEEAWTRELNRVCADADLACSMGDRARTRSEDYRPAPSLASYRQAYGGLIRKKEAAA